MCCRSSRQPPLWSRGSQTAVCFFSPVCQSLLAQVNIFKLNTGINIFFLYTTMSCVDLLLQHLFVVFFHLFRYLEPSFSLDAGHSHPYEELEAQLPSALLEELFGITLLIGRLKDLPANVQSAFTISNQGKVSVINRVNRCLWNRFVQKCGCCKCNQAFQSKINNINCHEEWLVWPQIFKTPSHRTSQ